MLDYIRDLSFLIVEDVVFQREMAVKLLESMGSEKVFSAEDGQAALEVLASLDQPIDIVISDLDMPGMDGVEFIRHAAEQNFCDAIAVSSGMDEKLIHIVEEIVKDYDVLVLNHLSKPMTIKKIEVLLENYLTASKARNPNAFPAIFSVSELHSALDNDQFKTWYQPKVSLSSGVWNSVEALTRWEHPIQGMVSPALFIDLLEKNELIDPLTWKQIHEVFQNFNETFKKNEQFTVSINISPIMLKDSNMPDKLMALVTYYQVKPDQIILEITENLLIDQSRSSLEVIARLKLKGFILSIDDFGTGYANLEHLTRVPFSELKLDQSFIRNITQDATKRAIVETNINLAKKLNITTVAEGVETFEDFDLLRHLGCDMAQGFFMGAGMPYDQLNAWHEQWKCQVSQHINPV